ncbi:phospholipase A [Limnobacter humi]|uniref:Phospholipase A1 n=1 Tax=Limnobacter humi TaxID=1778671 RepID=A0ABT1WD18_9BURK|nr:phospholipase A [Limnobacter humi]MCQ8895411.1 phospholipase A [Limnobacter humi]
MKRTLLFTALLGALSLAHADDIHYKTLDEQALRRCLFLEDDQLRLRCFDDATGRAQVAQGGKAPEVAAPLDGGLLLYKNTSDSTLSWLDQRWELSPESKRGTFQVRPYKPVYLLPLIHNSSPNTRPSSPNPLNTVSSPENLDQNETKFQLSLKTKVVENLFGDNGDVWFGYTQSSRWQVYNSDTSRPFRETNYEPELMFTWRSSWTEFAEATGWKPRLLGLSLNHQSNGRALPLSRSWNRVIGMVGLERENTLLQIRPWVRISEAKETDDNPDISDYMGRGDILLVHKINGHELSMLARHTFRGGDRSRGAIQLDWGIPITSNLRGHIQYFSGYGESLIDYNYKSDYLGVGFSLVGWY